MIVSCLLFLPACNQSVPEKVVGRWKIEKAWPTKKEDIFPSADFVNFLAEKGMNMFMDGKRTGYVTTKGDTVNVFPYDFRNDSLIIHTKGLDLYYLVEFKSADTLLLTDTEGLVIKYSKIKSAKK